MSWFKENKFAGTVIGLTAVASGALLYLGFSARSEANQAKAREVAAVDKIDALQSSVTFPSDVNEDKLEENLLKYALEAKSFQGELVKYRPAELKSLTPDAFNSIVSDYFNKLDKLYADKKITFLNGGNQHYGLSRYAGTMARETDTSYLNYNKQALEWLFETLANSGIDSVDHVYREPVAEKLGSPPPIEESPRGRKSAPVESLVTVSDIMPIELSFTGSEANLQKFISDVTSNEKYFFAIKLIKIRNEKRNPVSISEMSFAPVDDSAPDSDDEVSDNFGDVGNFDVNDGGQIVVDKTIIKQVIGEEKITVFLKLELHLFKKASEVIIPRVNGASVPAK